MRVARLIVLTIWLQGCQSLGFDPGMRDLPEEHFQGLWRVYEHCRVSHDIQAVRGDAEILSQAAFAHEGQAASVPDILASWVETPPVRLAVEPKAMAASCAVQGSHMAWQSGHPELAERLFSFVVRRFHEPPYLFYVSEARAGLAVVALIVPSPKSLSSALASPDQVNVTPSSLSAL